MYFSCKGKQRKIAVILSCPVQGPWASSFICKFFNHPFSLWWWWWRRWFNERTVQFRTLPLVPIPTGPHPARGDSGVCMCIHVCLVWSVLLTTFIVPHHLSCVGSCTLTAQPIMLHLDVELWWNKVQPRWRIEPGPSDRQPDALTTTLLRAAPSFALSYLDICHVCRKGKCAADRPSWSTGVNPSKKQKCCSPLCLWS